MGRRHTMRIAVSGLLLAGLLAACGGGGDDDDAGSLAEDGTTADTTTATGGSTTAATGATTPPTGEATATTSGGGDNGGGDNGEQAGDDELDSVQWGPDSPPIPEQYLAWSPSEEGTLRCELVPADPVDTFWGAAHGICLALTGQADWPAIDAVPPPPPNDSPYHACLDGELGTLLEQALAWHAEHVGETANLVLPPAGTHSLCQRSLYGVSVSTDEDSDVCGEFPTPRMRIELIAPGDPPDGDDDAASVREEPSCVPQDSQDNGFRQLRIIVAGQSEPRDVTIDVETDYGTLTTVVVVPALTGGPGTTGAPATSDVDTPSSEPTTASTVPDDTS